MAFLAPFIPLLVGGAVAVGASKLLSRGSPQQQQQSAPLTPTRNDALERAAAADNLARRTGARGARRTPRGGAEASTGARTSLLGRSN